MTKNDGSYGLNVLNIPPSQLKPNRWNPNVVSPDNESKLEQSLKRNGFFKPALTRQLDDGSLEIIGGEHRVLAATRLGYETVPVINLGKIDDERAREICILDNSRYGSDDALKLAELLEGLGDIDELASFMPYGEADLNNIFSSVNIALDDLDIDEEDEKPAKLAEKPIQQYQVLRFKIPVDDVADITSLIEKTIKTQGFTESDSLTNAGDALVHIFKSLSEK